MKFGSTDLFRDLRILKLKGRDANNHPKPYIIINLSSGSRLEIAIYGQVVAQEFSRDVYNIDLIVVTPKLAFVNIIKLREAGQTGFS